MVPHEVKSHVSSMRERDDAQLQRIGKKPVLKVQSIPPAQEGEEKHRGRRIVWPDLLTSAPPQRNFGLLSILGFSCTILGTWECLLR